jgi:hypothetical protein
VSAALSKLEIESLISDLQSILQMIEAGEMAATSSMRHRIEGAITVLKIVEGEAG